MKTIDEKCMELSGILFRKLYNLEEYVSRNTRGYICNEAEDLFREGVSFAQQWYSVDDELPEGDFVHVLTRIRGEYSYSYCVAFYEQTTKKWVVEINAYFPEIEYVPQEWRYIEIK